MVAGGVIPVSPDFSFVGALGDPVRMRQWAIWGLPRDDVSRANGVIVHESKLWPLCIDPQVRRPRIRPSTSPAGGSSSSSSSSLCVGSGRGVTLGN